MLNLIILFATCRGIIHPLRYICKGFYCIISNNLFNFHQAHHKLAFSRIFTALSHRAQIETALIFTQSCLLYSGEICLGEPFSSLKVSLPDARRLLQEIRVEERH